MLDLTTSRSSQLIRAPPRTVDGGEVISSRKEFQEIILGIDVESDDLSLASKPDEANEFRAEIRLWLRLLACTTLVSGKLRRNFREQFDFTLPRFELLAQLDFEPGGLVLGELSKRLMVSAGNITPILTRLIEEGYITRSPSSLDRRVQIVCLTVEGRKKFRRMAKKHGQWLNDMFQDVDGNDIEALVQQLSKLKRVLKDSEPDGAGK